MQTVRKRDIIRSYVDREVRGGGGGGDIRRNLIKWRKTKRESTIQWKTRWLHLLTDRQREREGGREMIEIKRKTNAQIKLTN